MTHTTTRPWTSDHGQRIQQSLRAADRIGYRVRIADASGAGMALYLVITMASRIFMVIARVLPVLLSPHPRRVGHQPTVQKPPNDFAEVLSRHQSKPTLTFSQGADRNPVRICATLPDVSGVSWRLQ